VTRSRATRRKSDIRTKYSNEETGMKQIVFDVDGVLLSEKRYFDASGLAAWEILFDSAYMGLTPWVPVDLTNLKEENIQDIRRRVWDNDRLLSWLKDRGINSNWEMVHAFLVTMIWLLAREAREKGIRTGETLEEEASLQRLGKAWKTLPVPTASSVLSVWEEQIPSGIMGNSVYDHLARLVEEDLGQAAPWTRLGQAAPWTRLASPFYHVHQMAFQQWYLGDDLFRELMGEEPIGLEKDGFLSKEEPICDAAETKNMLQSLKQAGYRISVATGRTRKEVEIPFRALGWYEEFDPLYIATATDAEETAQVKGLKSLNKPNPFLYLCAMYGRIPENYDAYIREKGTAHKDVIVIGDSLSDVKGARAAGTSFIGVLTGLDAEESRVMFQRENMPFETDVVSAVNRWILKEENRQ
jgi:phosphoglycolate phosphatase-like HAD superfamily hydrolase